MFLIRPQGAQEHVLYTLDDRKIWTLALFPKHMDKLPPGAQQRWLRIRN